MNRFLFILSIGIFTFNITGCAGFAEYVEMKDAKRNGEIASSSSYQNSLWKSGHGFNNPNNDRRRKGLTPVAFQKDDDQGFFSAIIGDYLEDMLGYTFMLTYNSVADLFNR